MAAVLGRYCLPALFGALFIGSGIWLIWDCYSTRTREEPVRGEVPGFVLGTLSLEWDREPVHYGLYFPPHFKQEEGPFPLIVFLHGYGERRKEEVFQAGFPAAIPNYLKNFGRIPFVGLFPIDPEGVWEPGSDGVTTTMAVLDHVVKRHRIDPARIYLTGHSSGGSGVWKLAEAYPKKWAAIAPLCANYRPDVPTVKHLPCWVYQGSVDKGIPVQTIRHLVETLRAAGCEVRYTELAGSGHIIWQQVYYKRDLFDWFAKKKRIDTGEQP
jgi:predicted peptidase